MFYSLNKIKRNGMAEQLKLIFDDQCPICCSFADWLKKLDRKKVFHFIRMNSVKRLEWKKALSTVNFNSIMVVEAKNYYFGGAALRKICHILTGLPLLNLIPMKLLNLGYQRFARKRYLLSGSKKKCSTSH